MTKMRPKVSVRWTTWNLVSQDSHLR